MISEVNTPSVQCEYCKTFLKNQTNLIKHQYSSKTCREIRKNIADNSIELLKTQNNELESELKKLIEDNVKKINYELEFQRQMDEKEKKMQLQLQYQKDLENKIKETQQKNLEIESELKKILQENETKLNEQLEANKKIESLKINLQKDIKIIIENNANEMHKTFQLKIQQIIDQMEKKDIITNTISPDTNIVNTISPDTNIVNTIPSDINYINTMPSDTNDVNIDSNSPEHSTRSSSSNETENMDEIKNTTTELQLKMLNNFLLKSNSSSKTLPVNEAKTEELFDPSLENEYGEIINKILSHINVFLSDKKINTGNVMYVIIEMMKFIENYYIKNGDKKEIVIYCIKKFMNLNDDQVDDFEDIILLINKFVGDIIDIAISIDSKKTKIKNINSCFVPFFS
jgi:hypothetical protein